MDVQDLAVDSVDRPYHVIKVDARRFFFFLSIDGNPLDDLDLVSGEGSSIATGAISPTPSVMTFAFVSNGCHSS